MYSKTKLLLIPIIITFLIAVGCSSQPQEARQSSIFRKAPVKKARIKVDSLGVKSGIGDSFKTVSNVKKNDEVDVIGEIKDWYVVRLDNNQIGTVDADKTEPTIEDKQEQNERAEPSQPDQNKNEAENLTSLERRMVNLVNNEREKNNLNPLKIDRELTNVARIKAQDMVDNNYFSHYSPNYGSPFDMMDEFGIEYLKAAENIAANTSVTKAHSSLMNSSGHRANILNPDFSHIGIGIKPSEKYGYIFVQMFISK